MEKQTEYEQEIDLVSLFFAVLHKYRQIFAAAVACAVLFGAVGIFKHVRSQKAAEAASENGEEIVRTAEEQKYEEDMVEYRAAQTAHDKNVASYNHQLKQNEADQARAEFDIKNAQEYIDKSVLNSLDPYNVNVANAVFYITTDYKILPGMDYQNPDYTGAVLSAYSSLLTSHETIGAIAEQFGMEERYMRELITVSVDSGTRLLTISTEGKDAQQANDIMDAMLKRFAQLYDVIESTVGEHETTQVSLSSTTTVLTSLRDQQQNTRDNMIQLQNNLTDLQSNHELLEQSIQTADKDFAATEKPKDPKGAGNSAVKYAAIGFLLGAVLVAGATACSFLVEGKVCAADELQKYCGIGVLGTLANDASQKAKGLDAAINKLEKRPDGSMNGAMVELIAATIHSRVPQAENILITGDISAQQLASLRDALQACSVLKGTTVASADSILVSSAAVQQAAQADVILLAADCACSKYRTVSAQNEKIRELGKEVLGCILYA